MSSSLFYSFMLLIFCCRYKSQSISCVGVCSAGWLIKLTVQSSISLKVCVFCRSCVLECEAENVISTAASVNRVFDFTVRKTS